MKKYTHPVLTYTFLRQKDGSSQNKHWRYPRTSLNLESSYSIKQLKTIKSTYIVSKQSIYKLYSTSNKETYFKKEDKNILSFWTLNFDSNTIL